MASANKGISYIPCFKGDSIMCSEFKRTAKIMLDEKYEQMRKLGSHIARKYFKIVVFEQSKEEI